MAVVGSITIWEKHKSRNGKQSPEDPSIDIVYGVAGTDDENAMNALVAATAPASWNTLTRQDWTHEYLGGVGLNGSWEVTVRYDRKDPKGPGTAQFSFDLSGGTQHITQSKQTMESDNDPAVFGRTPPPNCMGAIGVTDTAVEGCDVTVPKMELTITCIVAAAALDSDFLMQLRAATGKVNDRTFICTYQGQVLQFDEYELLFLGAPGNYRGDGSYEFNLKFGASLTVLNQNIGGVTDPVTGAVSGGITVAKKRGWDYLWVKYKEGKDSASNTFVRTPIAAYVERVYDSMNFDILFAALIPTI